MKLITLVDDGREFEIDPILGRYRVTSFANWLDGSRESELIMLMSDYSYQTVDIVQEPS